MKQFSSKKSIQILAHILQEYNIFHTIISPGSRNAPIAIHFSEMENMKCYSIVDERSAGFVALGMAKSIKKPVVLSCTSGSAVVNYYPAIVEAFYSNIPLLILTADRPKEFIDIFDGQTIRQENIFYQHSYGSFNLLEDNEINADSRNFDTIKKAVKICIEKQGPVHINIPLKEPLYEYISELPTFPIFEKDSQHQNYKLPKKLITEWNNSKKILILTGTLNKNSQLENLLERLAENHSAVILTEINSNLHHKDFFPHIDRYLSSFDEEDYDTFSPDLLITIGQNVVSKRIKEFLRNKKIAKHWHIDPYWQPDTYFSLSEKINSRAELFFDQLISKISLEPSNYYNIWNIQKEKLELKHQKYTQNVDFSDFKIYDILRNKIPNEYHIHLSNSSIIRYAQLFDFKENHTFYCNRGANGIDGSTSTAMGFAMMSISPTLLITGDLSFFYDINGLWNQYIPPQTRIIIINNGGGNIFRIIPGPDSSNAIDKLIATQHNKNAKYFAKAFNFEYSSVDNQNDFELSLTTFFTPSSLPKILEINTSKIDNAQVLRNYFNSLK